MHFNKLMIVIFILLFSINLYAFNISNINTNVIVKDNGSLQVTDSVVFTDVHKLDKINLSMVPVYDLVINSDIKNLDYNYSFNSLSINVPDCCILNNSISLDIVYLTDIYSFKKGNIASINYYPILSDYVNNFNLYFPKNTQLIDISVDFINVGVVNDQFVVNLSDVSNFDVNYSVDYKMDNLVNTRNYIFNFIYLFFIALILIVIIYFMFFKKKSSKVIDKNKDLLLGLNENEQKIINLLFVENGISQNKIALRLFLPKGTVSRNIKKLDQKGYIEINKYGVTNKVFLGKVFLKK